MPTGWPSTCSFFSQLSQRDHNPNSPHAQKTHPKVLHKMLLPSLKYHWRYWSSLSKVVGAAGAHYLQQAPLMLTQAKLAKVFFLGITLTWEGLKRHQRFSHKDQYFANQTFSLSQRHSGQLLLPSRIFVGLDLVKNSHSSTLCTCEEGVGMLCNFPQRSSKNFTILQDFYNISIILQNFP